MRHDEIKKKMREIVGPDNVTEGISAYSAEWTDRIAYSHDMISHITGDYVPDYVVLPGSVEEVQDIIQSANENDFFVYVYSRGTNTYGFTLAKEGGICVDLHRMDRILEINEETMTATVEPGVSWGKLRQEAVKKNLTIIPILGPHTGGVVGNYTSWNFTPYATRFSPDRVVSLEVVLPNGEILRTGSQALLGHDKANPYFRYAFGPDITGLFRGSVGAFGIITKAVVKLYPLLDGMKNITYGFQDLQSGLDTMQAVEKLDITKHIALYSQGWAGEMCNPELKSIQDPGVQRKILDKYPPWIVNMGICGKNKQIRFYEELIRDEITDGEEFDFATDDVAQWKDFVEGAGHRVTNMYGSARTAIGTLTITPFSVCPKVYLAAREKIKEFDYRDPVSDQPYVPTTMFFPTERGRSVYCEIDYRFDATRPETIEKLMNLWNKLSMFYYEELGSSLMIIDPIVRNMLSPSYMDVLREIKNVFDPKGLLSKGHFLEDISV
jgi:FAD/FMN-containing dehydrogenase